MEQNSNKDFKFLKNRFGLKLTEGVRDINITDSLVFKHVDLSEKYKEKWNSTHVTDFGILVKDGVQLNSNLYRIGGLGMCRNEKYFMLLRQLEELYSDNITTDKKKKRHLSNCSAILNYDGEEKIVFSCIDNPYLAGGVVYSLNSNYYNIETGYFYCNTSTVMKSKENIFLENKYDSDVKRRGIMVINKNTGEFIIHK